MKPSRNIRTAGNRLSPTSELFRSRNSSGGIKGATTLSPMQPDDAVINRWSDSAQFWEKHRAIIRQMFAPVAQALIDDAKIGVGQTVLDVATGPGEPALSVAEWVGPEGKVVGVDPIPAMIEGGRRAADRFGLKNVKFEVASADS